jgi:hypothetical protein
MPRRRQPQGKQSFIDAGLVRPPGSDEDSLYWKCDGCNHVAFWRLLTLCDASTRLCDWCMKEKGFKRMRGSRPLVSEGGE